MSLCYFLYAPLYVIYLHLSFIQKFFFCFLILYLGALFYKKKKRKEKNIEDHKKMWEIVVLTDKCRIKKMIIKKNVM